MAGVTLRTIRYYDQHDILKPSSCIRIRRKILY
ncbi:MAG: hypothetical protein ACLURP_01185 [Ruminococcus sp.]